MMITFRKLGFCVLILLMSLAGMGLAQEPVREPYTSNNGTLTLLYPPGWSVEENGGVIWLTSNPYDGDSNEGSPGLASWMTQPP